LQLPVGGANAFVRNKAPTRSRSRSPVLLTRANINNEVVADSLVGKRVARFFADKIYFGSVGDRIRGPVIGALGPSSVMELQVVWKIIYADGTEDEKKYEEYKKNLTPEEQKLLNETNYFYEVSVENAGGLIMPLIFEFTFEDGTKQIERIPAEIWKMSESTANKVFRFGKKVTNIALDPLLETADVELNNNFWPTRNVPSQFELFKQKW
jgi:hypothetical protein